MLRCVLEGGLLLSCVATLGYCTKLLGSWMLGAIEKLVCCVRLEHCCSAAEVLECCVRLLDRCEAGCCYARVLILNKEVILGAGLLLDIAIEAASVGVLRKAVDVVLLLGIGVLLSIERSCWDGSEPCCSMAN